MNAVVTALGFHLIFQGLDIEPVPGEEETRLVNLEQVRNAERRG